MRLLVVGGTGWLGGAIARAAAAAGHDLLVYLPVPHIHGNTSEIASHVAEITDFRPGAVVDTTQARADTTRSVLGTIAPTCRRYVLVSSGDVYRGYGVFHRTEEGPLQPMPVNEDADLRTLPSFDQSEGVDKIFAERAALEQDDIAVTIVRAPAIFGSKDPQDRIGRRARALDEAGAEFVLPVSRGSWRFCYGYLDDVVRALLLCAEDKRPGHRVYNVAYRDGVSEAEMYGLVGEAAGWSGAISTGDDPAAENRNYLQHLCLDSSRIRAELGYAEEIPIQEAIRRTLRADQSPPLATKSHRIPNLKIRPVRESDLGDLARNVFPGNAVRNVENRVREHLGGHRHTLVAELDGVVVGTVNVGGSRHAMPGSLRLFSLDVAEAYRGRGIGTALIRAVERMAAERSLSRVNLEVGTRNWRAKRLYERLGYRIAEGPVYDSWQVLLDDGSTVEEGEHVWIMVKKLAA